MYVAPPGYQKLDSFIVVMFTCRPPGLFAPCHTPVTVSRYVEDAAI